MRALGCDFQVEWTLQQYLWSRITVGSKIVNERLSYQVQDAFSGNAGSLHGLS